MIRLHAPAPLSLDAAVLPTLDQSRYLTQVMRLKTGDSLLVFNGRDGEWRCVISEILKKGVVLRAEEQEYLVEGGPPGGGWGAGLHKRTGNSTWEV